MSALAAPTNMSKASFTICASLRRSVAWKWCRSIEIAESQGKERDVRGRKRFSVVLVAAFDRVARSVRHFLQLMDEFDSLGVVFISRRENIDTSGPMGRLFLTLIGSISELESALIRDRVLAGMRRAALDGVRIGRAPMNIDRAAVVRDRISGMSLTTVAKKWGISRSLVCKLVKRSRAGDEGFVLPPSCVVDSAHVMRSRSAEAGW
jgi:Resolvase, N terminal domain